MFEIKYFGN